MRDVVIIGGGLSGATLAIQLKQRRPSLPVTILERQRFPVPDAAYKVGESSVEIGSHYFNEVLGLSHALIPSKIPKLGLRYFFPHGDNQDITLRPELGQTHYHAVGSTQFDRGRQENILREQCLRLGVQYIDQAKVVGLDVTTDPASAEPHRVRYERLGPTKSQTHELTARWLVDAAGRPGLLKRTLDLAQPNDHAVNASWWRIDEPLAVDHLSDDRDWQRRVPFGMRRLSTNHFVGRGYWVWFIPLATGSISIGIVADPAYHPLPTLNTLPRAIAWLREHEPQAHALIEPHLSRVQDFRTHKHFSHAAKQVFSGQRWALTGDAGVFIDPFYSPGSDFIAMSNGFITALIDADERGEDIDALARGFDRQYLALYRSFLLLYQDQYGMFGNAQAMSLKIVWDYSGYWGSTALLYFQDKLCDPAFMKSVAIDTVQVFRLNSAAQKFFRAWDRIDDGQWAEPKLLNYQVLDYLAEWQALLLHRYDDKTLRRALRENRKVMELVVRWLYRRATGSDETINPYRLTLDERQIEAPVRRLDMFEQLNDYINARTEVQDGVRTVIEPAAPAESA